MVTFAWASGEGERIGILCTALLLALASLPSQELVVRRGELITAKENNLPTIVAADRR